MINFREIFNPSYNIVGLVIIILLIVVLFLLERNMKDFFKNVGMIGIRTGIVSLVLGLVVSFVLNFLPHSYKIFVEVISDNVIKGILSSSVVVLIIGIFLYLISIFLCKKLKEDNA